MKFVMNGSLIIGTMDGANVEIAEEVGKENMFIFGAEVKDVDPIRAKMHGTDPQEYLGKELSEIFDAIGRGDFGDAEYLEPLLDTIRHRNDYYIVGHDFSSYVECQKKVDEVYKN